MKSLIFVYVVLTLLVTVQASAQTAVTKTADASCGFNDAAYMKTLFYETSAEYTQVQGTFSDHDRACDTASIRSDTTAMRLCQEKGLQGCQIVANSDANCDGKSGWNYGDYYYRYTAHVVGYRYKRRDDKAIAKEICPRLDACELANLGNGDALNALNRMSEKYRCGK